MRNPSNGAGLVAPTRAAIARRLSQGQPSVIVVAAELGVHVRTLQRRLVRTGVTYSDLVDEVRLDTARRLLEGHDGALAEIATALGYTDPAHFSRAFVRWNGITPSAYRRLGRPASSDQRAGDLGPRRQR